MIINGKKENLKDMTIKELLISHDLKEDHVVVEVNELIIEKSLYDNTILDQNSRIEIIAFVGGG